MKNHKITIVFFIPLICLILMVINGFFLGGLFVASIIFIILYNFLQIYKINVAMDKKDSLSFIHNVAVCFVGFVIILAALRGRDRIPPFGF